MKLLKEAVLSIIILTVIIVIANLSITTWISHRTSGNSYVNDSMLYYSGDTLIFEGIKYTPVK